jgi:hypothetical protein
VKQRLLLSVLLFVATLAQADLLPPFGPTCLLTEANVLRMTPPFETRYYFTFRSEPGDSATVFLDIYYHHGAYDDSKNRVLVGKGSGNETLVPPSEYQSLLQRLPKSLMLAEGAAIGISLEDCVSNYAKLLSRLAGIKPTVPRSCD